MFLYVLQCVFSLISTSDNFCTKNVPGMYRMNALKNPHSLPLEVRFSIMYRVYQVFLKAKARETINISKVRNTRYTWYTSKNRPSHYCKGRFLHHPIRYIPGTHLVHKNPKNLRVGGLSPQRFRFRNLYSFLGFLAI